MKTIISFLKSYRIAIVVALSLMLMELTVELLQPLLISKIIDDGIANRDTATVFLWGGIMVGMAFVAFIAGITNTFYASHVSQGFGFDVRDRLYKKVQTLSYAKFLLFPTSSLITRMTNDVTQMQTTLFMGLRMAMRAPLMVLGGLVMSFFVHAKLALVFAVTIPLVIVFLVWMMRKAGPLFSKVQEKLDRVNNVMQENLVGMRLIKAYLRRGFEMTRFTRSSEQLKEKTVTALRTVELTMPIILLIMNLTIMAILWFGHGYVTEDSATVGQIVALINYAMRITMALSMISMIIMTLSRSQASAERVSEVLNTHDDLFAPDEDEQPNSLQAGEVAFDHVSFRYPGASVPVLKNITFSAKPGQTVAILGATGSGKSTLFQLIPRLYDPDQGAIRLGGIDLRKLTFSTLRNSVGFVPQESFLFSGTVKENITWGKPNATTEEMIEAAKRAQIHDTILRLPNQYETVLGQKGVNLSGGQKQRLSIARALIRRPNILLMDDSTSALDVTTEAKLLEALKDLQCSIFIITQKISTAWKADQILLLDGGQIIASGRHEELMRRSRLYQKIVHSQYGEGGISHAAGAHSTV